MIEKNGKMCIWKANKEWDEYRWCWCQRNLKIVVSVKNNLQKCWLNFFTDFLNAYWKIILLYFNDFENNIMWVNPDVDQSTEASEDISSFSQHAPIPPHLHYKKPFRLIHEVRYGHVV